MSNHPSDDALDRPDFLREDWEPKNPVLKELYHEGNTEAAHELRAGEPATTLAQLQARLEQTNREIASITRKAAGTDEAIHAATTELQRLRQQIAELEQQRTDLLLRCN